LPSYWAEYYSFKGTADTRLGKKEIPSSAKYNNFWEGPVECYRKKILRSRSKKRGGSQKKEIKNCANSFLEVTECIKSQRPASGQFEMDSVSFGVVRKKLLPTLGKNGVKQKQTRRLKEENR